LVHTQAAKGPTPKPPSHPIHAASSYISSKNLSSLKGPLTIHFDLLFAFTATIVLFLLDLAVEDPDRVSCSSSSHCPSGVHSLGLSRNNKKRNTDVCAPPRVHRLQVSFWAFENRACHLACQSRINSAVNCVFVSVHHRRSQNSFRNPHHHPLGRPLASAVASARGRSFRLQARLLTTGNNPPHLHLRGPLLSSQIRLLKVPGRPALALSARHSI